MKNEPHCIGWYNKVAIRVYSASERNWTCDYDTADKKVRVEVEGVVIETVVPGVKDLQTYTSLEIAKRETLMYAQYRLPGPFRKKIDWRDL